MSRPVLFEPIEPEFDQRGTFPVFCHPLVVVLLLADVTAESRAFVSGWNQKTGRSLWRQLMQRGENLDHAVLQELLLFEARVEDQLSPKV